MFLIDSDLKYQTTADINFQLQYRRTKLLDFERLLRVRPPNDSINMDDSLHVDSDPERTLLIRTMFPLLRCEMLHQLIASLLVHSVAHYQKTAPGISERSALPENHALPPAAIVVVSAASDVVDNINIIATGSQSLGVAPVLLDFLKPPPLLPVPMVNQAELMPALHSERLLFSALFLLGLATTAHALVETTSPGAVNAFFTRHVHDPLQMLTANNLHSITTLETVLEQLSHFHERMSDPVQWLSDQLVLIRQRHSASAKTTTSIIDDCRDTTVLNVDVAISASISNISHPTVAVVLGGGAAQLDRKARVAAQQAKILKSFQERQSAFQVRFMFTYLLFVLLNVMHYLTQLMFTYLLC